MFKTLFFTILLLSGNAFADKADIINHLGKFFGQIDQEDIVETPFKGVYEVITYNPIDSMLVSEDGKYLIQGDVVDLTTRKLMSKSNKIKGIKKALINSVDDADKIIYQASNEKYAVHVFTDVDCPFCLKLHNEIAQMNQLGITVKYLASPLASLHPAAQGKMQKIWCADDKAQAMNEYKNNKKIPDSAACDNPVAEQLIISKMLGVNGTPAIFLADGTHLPGYVPAASLLKEIEQSLVN